MKAELAMPSNGDNDALLEAAQEAMAAGRVEDALAYLQAVHGDLAEIASVWILCFSSCFC